MADSMYGDYGSYGGGGYNSPVNYGSPTFGNDRIQMSLGNDPWETYNYGTPQGIYQGNTLPESPEQTAIRQQLSTPQTFYAPADIEPSATKEADDLAKYRSFLADNFINPDTIGTARLYTDPVTGQRKMEVPSIRQEEQAMKESEQAKNFVNKMKRLDMEARRDAKKKGEGASPQVMQNARYIQALDEANDKAIGVGNAGNVDAERAYFLNKIMYPAGYQTKGYQTLSAIPTPTVQAANQSAYQQPTYDFRRPVTNNSNGYS